MVSRTSTSFDISLLEIFGPLLSGGRVCVITEEDRLSGAVIREACVALAGDCERVIFQTTPSVLRAIEDAFFAETIADVYRERLVLLLGGEAIPTTLTNVWVTRVASLRAMYGPTEKDVWVSTCVVDSEIHDRTTVPLGEPIVGVRFCLIGTEHTYLLPPHSMGELVLSGAAGARGYLHDAAQSDQRFGYIAGQWSVLTGDRVRCNASVEFLSRLGDFVKVNGTRLHLGALQQALITENAGIQEAYLFAFSLSGDDCLAAVVVFTDTGAGAGAGTSTSTSVGEKSVAGFMSPVDEALFCSVLPVGMALFAYRLNGELPRNANGKVNIPLLRLCARDMVERHDAYIVLPSTAVEQEVLTLAKTFLGEKARFVGMDSSLGSLGSSLFMIRFQVAIRERFHAALLAPDVFAATTRLSALASQLERLVLPQTETEASCLAYCQKQEIDLPLGVLSMVKRSQLMVWITAFGIGDVEGLTESMTLRQCSLCLDRARHLANGGRLGPRI
jgi:hypothetical protein